MKREEVKVGGKKGKCESRENEIQAAERIVVDRGKTSFQMRAL